MKQIITFIFLIISFNTTLFAESSLTCPSVKTIKQKNNMWPFGMPWYPLYVDNAELAFKKDIETFIQDVTQFEHAEWGYHFSESAHCFYRGNTRIMLVSNLMKPKNDDPHWEMSPGNDLGKCSGTNENDCEFGAIVTPQVVARGVFFGL